MRKNNKELVERKPIKCPVCCKRLMDTKKGIDAYVLPIEIDEDETAEFFTKCKRCGRVIGIRKIS